MIRNLLIVRIGVFVKYSVHTSQIKARSRTVDAQRRADFGVRRAVPRHVPETIDCPGRCDQMYDDDQRASVDLSDGDFRSRLIGEVRLRR